MRRSMPPAFTSGYGFVEQIETLRFCMGAPGRVLVGKERPVERREEMFPLPAIEVGDPREHHAREKEEGAELRPRPQSGSNQMWLFDIATGDGLNVFRGATSEHFHMVRGRTGSVGTASKLRQVVTNVRQLEWRHSLRRRRFQELLHGGRDVANPSTQRLPHSGGGGVRRDERRPGRAKTLSDAALGVREKRRRDSTNVFVGWRRVEAFSERRHEHAEVYDRGEAKKINVRKESRVDVYCVDGRHPANDLICHPMFARESRWVYGVRIPLAHPRHDFELRLLGGNGKQNHSVKQVGGVWRRVIGALDVDQGALQVSVVEQVADDDLRAGRAQRLGPLVLATDQGTNGKPALQ